MKGSLALLVLAGAMLLPPAALADVWEPVSGTPPTSLGGGTTADIRPDAFRAYTLDDDPVAAAPAARSLRASTVLTLPAPDGSMQRFEVTESPIMEPGLAARHPEITTYAGRGIDDPAATIRADQTPLGFHASVRAPGGAWYVDPYYHLDDSVYITYYGRDVSHDPHGGFVEQELDEDVNPLALAAVPQGPEVQRRTYRLALVTDPGYSTFFGGPQNVTAAKVTLMNRVNQIYEDETAIRLVLIADTDKLNLNTPGGLMGPNGPCGAAPVLRRDARAAPAARSSARGSSSARSSARATTTSATSRSARRAAASPASASSAATARRRAAPGSRRRSATSSPSTTWRTRWATSSAATTPSTARCVNCSGGNRSAASSVEPGSGTSIMAYAGICEQDNLQPHSDPYWSQRSFDEITAYVTSDRPPINEVQTASLRDFDGTDSFRLRFDGHRLGPDRPRRQLHARRHPGGDPGASEVQTFARGAEPVHAQLPGRRDGADRPRPERHGARDPERDRGRQRAAGGHAHRLQPGHAVVPGPDRRRHLGRARRRRAGGQQRATSPRRSTPSRASPAR